MIDSRFHKVKILSFLLFLVFTSILLESIYVDKLVLFAILVHMIIRGLKEKTFINPYNLFAFTPFSLLIYVNVSEFYMLHLTHDTYVLAIINIVAFIGAFSLTPGVNKAKILRSRKETSKMFLRVNTVFLLGVALIGYAVPALQSIVWLFCIPAMVCALKLKEKRILLLVGGYILFTAAISLSKMAVLLYILTLLVAFEKFYNFSKKQGVWMKILAVVGVVFLIYSFSFANKDRGNYDADLGMNYYSQQGAEWSYSTSLFLPYMYLTTPWTNLQYVTEQQNTRTNGLWLLKPVINYVQLDEDFKKDYELEPYSSFNTFTFITVGFKDFGFWFSILSPLLLGFIVKKVYSRYLVSRSPFDIAIYIVFGLAIIEMFFSNHFFMHSYPFTMIIIMWGYQFFVFKGKKY